MDPRTPEFRPTERMLYGEDLPTEIFQRLKFCQGLAKQNAREANDEAIDRNISDHNKSLSPRQFKEGELVLLKIKYFRTKNRKLSTEWKGPYTVQKTFSNNTVLIRAKYGKHDYLYNANMLKTYRPEDWTKSKTKSQKENETEKVVCGWKGGFVKVIIWMGYSNQILS